MCQMRDTQSLEALESPSIWLLAAMLRAQGSGERTNAGVEKSPSSRSSEWSLASNSYDSDNCRWSPQLTEQLWALIKAKPELKRLLVNEPSRHLGPMGAGMQLFSKKDLQRTIAEHLFNDGSYDFSDPVVMDNLTRAVKNKLHKYVIGRTPRRTLLRHSQDTNAVRRRTTPDARA